MERAKCSKLKQREENKGRMKRKSVREEKTEVSDFNSGKSSFFSWTAEVLIMGLKLNIGPEECSVGLGCDV